MYFLSHWICPIWTFNVNGIICFVVFFVWSLLSRRYFQASSVLQGQDFMFLWLYHVLSLFISWWAFGFSPFFGYDDNASWNICIHILAWRKVFGVLGHICKNGLSHTVTWGSTWRIIQTACKGLAALCLPTSSVWGTSCRFIEVSLQ